MALVVEKQPWRVFFAELGVPIYIADDEARRLTNTSKSIRKKIIALLGTEAYSSEGINRKYVAEKIFNDTHLLQRVSKIIHPKVTQHFNRWVKKQNGPYCIKEAAILFENGGYKDCDLTILVTAPVNVRVQRILERDNTTRLDIEDRISNQWDDEKKLLLANFHIENIDLETTKKQVKELHDLILKH